MTARDYPITFPFGTTLPPYSETSPHLGADRAMPIGVAVEIAGMIIGLSGETGAADGPHTHQAKWKSGQLPGGIYVKKYKATYFDPSDVLDTPGTVSSVGFDSAAGNFVRWSNDDGYTREVFHMSKINVQVGQIIGGNVQEQIDKLNAEMTGVYEQLNRLNAEMSGVYTQLDESRAKEKDLQEQINNIEAGSADGTYELKKVG